MAAPLLPSSLTFTSATVAQSQSATAGRSARGAAAGRLWRTETGERRRHALIDHHVSPWQDSSASTDFSVDKDDDLAKEHAENVSKVRIMLTQQASSRQEGLLMVDHLKHLCIGHHFIEDINSILDLVFSDYCDNKKQDEELFYATLSFNLLRQAGYPVTPGRMGQFLNGRFDETFGKNLNGLLSLHEASYLNFGNEEILLEAHEFSTKHLKNLLRTCTNPTSTSYIGHVLRHPNHHTPPHYNARYCLNYLRATNRLNRLVEELSRIEFQINRTVHMEEFQIISRWKKGLQLEQELPQVRAEVMTWYAWSMACFQGIHFSHCRIWYTKIIALIYIIDDIFDIIGSEEDLTLFVDAIKRWDFSTMSSLPDYMKVCYITVYRVTNEIAEMVEKKHGLNPIDSLRKSWVGLFDASMVQHKWFSTEQRPKAEEYLETGRISSGMQLAFVCMFLLIGQGVTRDNLNAIEAHSPLFSAVADILRLCDDLVSAKVEGVEGVDGSYVECYMKENPSCTLDEARHHVTRMIASAWEELNRECYSNISFSHDLRECCMNLARYIAMAFTVDDYGRLAALENYTSMLLPGHRI